MKMRLSLVVTAAVLAASTAAAQSRIQREIVLLAQPVQQVSVNAMAEIQRPAIRVGGNLFLGVAVPTGNIFGNDCYEFYFLQDGEEIPDSAQEFVSVVVGVGSTRGYLWRGPFLHAGDCIGAAPRLPKP